MNDSLDCLQAYKEYLIEREMSENTIEKYLRDVRWEDGSWRERRF